jgi:hypothetical protein
MGLSLQFSGEAGRDSGERVHGGLLHDNNNRLIAKQKYSAGRHAAHAL